MKDEQLMNSLRSTVRTSCWSVALMGLSLMQAAEGGPPLRPGLLLEEFVFETAPFPSCHAATAVELANGELLCAFFGGTRERHPDVEIWIARKPVDGLWTAPVSVADGMQSGYDLPLWLRFINRTD